MRIFRPLLAILASLAVATAASLPHHPTTTPFYNRGSFVVSSTEDSRVDSTNMKYLGPIVVAHHSQLLENHPAYPATSARIIHNSKPMTVEYFRGGDQTPENSLGRVLIPRPGRPLIVRVDKGLSMEDRMNINAEVLAFYRNLPSTGPASRALSAKAARYPGGPLVVTFYKTLRPRPGQPYLSQVIIPPHQGH